MSRFTYGKNSAYNALENKDGIKSIYVLNNFSDERLLNVIKSKRVKLNFVNENELIKKVGRVNHQGIVIEKEDFPYLTLDELLDYCESKTYPTIVMLDQIEDPHNFGAILRSGDAFEIDGYIILSRRQVKVTETVSHCSTGADEYSKIAMVNNLSRAIDILKERGYWVVASDGYAKISYKDVDYKMKTVLIVGSEGYGISKLLLDKSDFITKIPMGGHVTSLNASVASSLYFQAIYESKRK